MRIWFLSFRFISLTNYQLKYTVFYIYIYIYKIRHIVFYQWVCHLFRCPEEAEENAPRLVRLLRDRFV